MVGGGLLAAAQAPSLVSGSVINASIIMVRPETPNGVTQAPLVYENANQRREQGANAAPNIVAVVA